MTELHTVMSGLVVGESPRWHEHRLWLSNWGAQQIIAVDVEGACEVMLRVSTTVPLSIDWLPDGRLLVVSVPEARLLRQEPDGSLVTHADLSGLASGWNEIVVDGRGNGIYGPDAPPPPEVAARMDEIMADVNALVEEARAAGAWVFNGGLHAPSTATVVRLNEGEVLITDRPYTEGKEPIGGCLMVTASDLDAALVSTRKLVAVLGNGLDSLPVEVRPFRGEPDGS